VLAVLERAILERRRFDPRVPRDGRSEIVRARHGKKAQIVANACRHADAFLPAASNLENVAEARHLWFDAHQ
jgi:hypothetical protein